MALGAFQRRTSPLYASEEAGDRDDSVASSPSAEDQDDEVHFRTSRHDAAPTDMTSHSRERPSQAASTAYSIVLEPAEGDEGIWTAEVPALGLVTEGLGPDGARDAARDAIEGFIEVATRTGRPVPPGDVVIAPHVAWSAAPPVRRERPHRK
jgi:predicted RNase H-like HicB family nuclease